MILQKVKLLLIANIFILISLSSSAEIDPKIVGGSSTTISSYPWQVAVLYLNGPWCGGCIIASRWILTAAHCVYRRLPAHDFKVRAGSSTWNAGGTLAQARRLIHHSKYNDLTVNYDVALIQLRGPLTYKPGKIKNILLAQQLPASRIPLWVSGWGVQRFGSPVSPSQLRAVEIRYIPRPQCNSLLNGGITNEMLCAGYLPGGRDSCSGDSGGPLVRKSTVSNRVQRVLLGIVSWGYDCGDPQSPNVYTSVPRFVDWIKLAIKNNS